VTLLAGEGMPLRKALKALEKEFGTLVIWQKENQHD
jgi:hypothetical protein